MLGQSDGLGGWLPSLTFVVRQHDAGLIAKTIEQEVTERAEGGRSPLSLLPPVSFRIPVAFPRLLSRAFESRNGPRHLFELSGQTQFLDESVALERARYSLFLDGLTNEVWEPASDGRTVAPDGRADIYLARNAQNPKRGFLMFTSAQGARSFLQLAIEGTNLVCQRVVGK